ncbi:MAG: hypothetical protein KVP17_002428 [Porospora cf. gigantea B]|nr:MAG: hypothetical protein KVP17_002428 [Porospora cf. gigantea B]
MMTRLNSNVDKGLKCAGPRWLQPSQWGLLCPCDTPEGEACGLVKNLSLMTHVTNDEDDTPLVRIAYALGVEAATAISGEELHDPGTCIVFLNGLVLGVHRGPAYLMRSFRRLRRMSKIGQFVSIFENPLHRAIYIASDGGRLSRPLIIVEDGQSRLTNQHMQKLAESEIDFMDLLRTAVLEWIDVNEENSCLIAIREENITPDTTHLEIDPLTMMGVVAGLIPYPNHNQSPRNTYQCAMGKQAMGAIAYNQFNRTDSVMYLLVYPQRPLVQTRTLEFIKWWELPAGHNCSVAVMSYSGYDIEDAICMNRGSIDRGFGRCYVLKRQSTELKRYPNGAQDMVLPPPDGTGQGKSKSRAVNTRFACLDDDGVGRVGALVSEDQVYINKHVPVITKDALVDQRSVDSSYRPDTVRYKAPVPAFIDKIVVAENHEGNRVYKCCFRQVRKPEYGDKFSSRHGQKGVVGFIVEPEDMPFTESGWTPDLIMNPHGFPSRMTIGKMLELLGGKSALLDGKVKYGTAFGGTPLHEIEGILTANGFHYSGKEYLTSGITGQALQTYIFTGPIYYQKLKHMVQDKIHARGRGPRQMLTRQPTEGRAKMGGLRLGEMERDCLVAYGAANLLIERLMLSSDAFKAYVCATCGLLVSPNWCQFCKSESNVTVIQLPYACKLLFQEMLSMNVACRLRLKET